MLRPIVYLSIFSTMPLQVLAQTADTLNNAAAPQETPFWDSVWDVVSSILIVAFFVIAIVHMVKELRKRHYTPHTVDEFKLGRMRANQAEESSEEEDELAQQYLEDIFDHWHDVSETGEEELRAPTRRVHLVKSMESIRKVEEIKPTSPEVVERMNELGNVINVLGKRRFSGSWLLMLVSGLLLVFLYYQFKTVNESVFSNLMDLWWIWASIIFYYLASYAPEFLIEKRKRKLGSGNFSSGAVGFFAGLFLAAPTFDYISRRRDGSQSSHSEFNLIGLIFMIVGLALLGSFIIFFGILNYLRNFILYL